MRSSGAVADVPRPIMNTQIGATALLDIDKIRQLIDMMIANDLTEISLRDGDMEVSLRRPTTGAGDVVVSAGNPACSPNPASTLAGPRPSSDASAAKEPDPKRMEIKSPMVGTFYAAHDPDSTPFVDVGSMINPNTVVCVIEAMKVFNEIKAEVTGTIEKVLVKNEQPIEYGQPLFLVRTE